MFINGITLILMINVSYFLSLFNKLHYYMAYTQVHLYRNISHSLGRKNKTQNLILPFFCASLSNWPDQRWARVSLISIPEISQLAAQVQHNYGNKRKTKVQIHKCHDCRRFCLSASCSAVFSHVCTDWTMSESIFCCWGSMTCAVRLSPMSLM